MTGLNPLNWYGTEFLVLYGTLLILAAIASRLIENRLRPVGRATDVHDEDELAVLAGGRTRLAEATVVRLLDRGALQIAKKRLIAGRGASGQTMGEKSVLALVPPVRWRRVEAAMSAPASEIEDALVRRRLLLSAGEAFVLGLNVATPFLMLFCLGMAKLLVGLDRDRPVGVLEFLLVVTALVALWRWFRIDRRTGSGAAVLRAARGRGARLRSAPTGAEMGLAVALFGTGVIAGSYLSAFLDFRRDGSGADGGSDGDGGSGCGGGCGGCG